MPVYNSSYAHGVDEKRRLKIPAKWRGPKAFTLVLWPYSPGGACLRVLPPAQATNMLRDIEAMPNGEQKTMLKRIIGRDSEQVTLDGAGRMLLPERMAREAGITDQAVLVGLLDRFEIYSPERSNKVKEADSVMAREALKLIG
jgi:MraZ protein